MLPILQRFDALAVADDRGVIAAPGSVLVERLPAGSLVPADTPTGSQPWRFRVLAVGTPDQVGSHPLAGGSGRFESAALATSVLLPGFVNAHTHLDLTHIGPLPFDPDAGFVGWIDAIRRARRSDAPGIAASVAMGTDLSIRAGVVAVADIAGAPRGRSSLVPAVALARSGLSGLSLLEFFAIGRGLGAFQTWLPELIAEGRRLGLTSEPPFEPRSDRTTIVGSVRVGLQPHAPNTVDARAYRWAAGVSAALQMPLATHLAETRDERRFVGEADGPQREFLQSLNLWDDSILTELGPAAQRNPRERHPINHTLCALQGHPSPLLVHVNDLGPGESREEQAARAERLDRLSNSGGTVVYCPRASSYFRAHETLGPHAYREMLDAGVPVALGTDSVVNLPPVHAGAGAQSLPVLSTFDEARFLFRRDGTKPETLLAMATTLGARALGFEPGAFRFERGAPLAGLNAVDLRGGPGDGDDGSILARALRSESPVRVLLHSARAEGVGA